MHHLDVAILKTVIYGDIFHFPMTPREIHHFLISDDIVDVADVINRLTTSVELADVICNDGTYFALASREELFELRRTREQMMTHLQPQVQRYGRILAYFPFVELVGVTGALSMRNPSTTTDDLDYLVITKPGRVWLTRALIIVLVRLMRLRKIEICPNYVLASDQLVQARRDLYIAHEVTQLLPLSNLPLYWQLRNQNNWTADYLPNANEPFHKMENRPLNRIGKLMKQGIEGLLSTPIGNWLEKWEYRRKSSRFQHQATAPTASAEIDEGHVKGHFEDYGHYVLQRYDELVQSYQLDNISTELQSAGD